jgi:hypothetical protein
MRNTVVRDTGVYLLGSDVPVASAEFSPDWDDDDPAKATYRYLLTRVWDVDLPPAVLLMLNPSKATHEDLDPTVQRQITRAQRLGAGGLNVLNAFALRDTNPKALLRHPDPVGPCNDEVIAEVLARPLTVLIVAWGADPAVKADDRAREKRVAELIAAARQTPMCLRVVKGGHPGHPLYLGYDTPLTPWVAA